MEGISDIPAEAVQDYQKENGASAITSEDRVARAQELLKYFRKMRKARSSWSSSSTKDYVNWNDDLQAEILKALSCQGLHLEAIDIDAVLNNIDTATQKLKGNHNGDMKLPLPTNVVSTAIRTAFTDPDNNKKT